MEELGIPLKLVNLTKTTKRNVKCKVRIQNNPLPSLQSHHGLRQGGGLACVLFNLALGKVIRDASMETKGTTVNKSVQILAYADDVDIVGRTTYAVRKHIWPS
jgi:hypothetical protein